MKARFPFFALPIILLFTVAFGLLKLVEIGRGPRGPVQRRALPALRTTVARVNDLKFALRGPLAPANPIVIVAIDSPSLDEFGRWPWHREVMARLIQAAMDAGAKVVGLDMVFAEADRRTPEGLQQALAERGLAGLAAAYETDPVLAQVIQKNADRLVLGWQTESACQPGLEPMAECPVTVSQYWQSIPPEHGRLAIPDVRLDKRLHPQKTPLMSAVTVLANLAPFTAAARHAGHYNAFLDPDGVVRSTYPVIFAAGRPHPSLPLEMARVGLGDRLLLHVTANQRLGSLRFERAGYQVPLSDLGQLRVNFYGPRQTFPYLPARQLLHGDPETLRRLRGAYVLIGLTALGVHDLRAFPFDANMPGVEGHATILDNLLARRPLRAPQAGPGVPVVILLMSLGAALLALALHRLAALPGILTFLVTFGGLVLLDVAVLFAHNIVLDTGLLYLELLVLLVVVLAVKYVREERARRFVRSTFSRYVSPAVVDSILADPGKLSLGGEKKDLSILFSDLRGFTTISERLDARALVDFLNDYLGRMTDIVFSHGGTLDKYIGDAVMAFWGAPLPQPDHAHRALAAALDMLRAVDDMKDAARQRFGIDLDIGLGVTSGIVNVGNMGSYQNVEYTVIGDRVNLASRLESLTKTYGVRILTTIETIDAIQRAGQAPPPHQVIDRVRVKGKSEAVELVEVLPPAEQEQGRFAQARAMYLERRWQEARAAFAGLHEEHPRRLYALFAERCVRLSQSPPAEDWRGEWEMESK